MLAIIGGSGLAELSGFELLSSSPQQTGYADDPVTIHRYRHSVSGKELLFLNRHSDGHRLPPHRINYRANLAALKAAEATAVIAINVVGGIHQSMGPGCFAIPDQLIDYTWGRSSTYFDGEGSDLSENQERLGEGNVVHVDFTEPMDAALNLALWRACERVNADRNGQVPVMLGACYGVTQGPRLESKAEIERLRRDGCDLVGMTAMPEAALARELQLPYSMLALSVNWAAGLSEETITLDDIAAEVTKGGSFFIAVLDQLLTQGLPNF